MTIAFGNVIFDKIDHDRDADVLYLSVSGVEPAHWEESPEGHALRFDENGTLCGVTVVGLSHHLDEHGRVPLTVPKREELGLEELDLALV